MLNQNIETFIGCDCDYRDADIVLFGAPFDSTTSFRPGARFGSSYIRHESFGIETYSPYQDKDLLDFKVFDSGDLELSFGDAGKALTDIENRADIIFNDGKLPLMLGGEHLVTLGAVRAAVKKYPDLHIIHFDAHADLRDDYLGAKLSHACVMRRCHELTGDGRIHQFCIRSGEKSFADGRTFLYSRTLGKGRRRAFRFRSLRPYRGRRAGQPVLSVGRDPGSGDPRRESAGVRSYSFRYRG